jgi:hypothetical protein
MNRRRAICLVLLAVLSFACTRAKPEPQVPEPTTTLPPAPSATAGPSATEPPTGQPTTAAPSETPSPQATEVEVCELVAEGNLMAYERPSIAAEVFTTVPPALRVRVEAVTADGWVGFDPGYAQAGNVGVFRLRWVRAGGAFSLRGSCDDLRVVVGPPAGVCFTMAMGDTPVYAQSDESSPLVVTLLHGDYAEVLQVGDDWLYVNLLAGSLQLDQRGWIARDLANFNGPCESIPTVTP